MPAWMTPLLWVLVSIPGRGWRSRMQTRRPRAPSSAAMARPTTPAPITATSTSTLRDTHREFTLLSHFDRYRHHVVEEPHDGAVGKNLQRVVASRQCSVQDEPRRGEATRAGVG